MKYALKNGEQIDAVYRRYLGNENIYGLLFGHKLTRNDRQKAAYIWKTLLKQAGLKL
jgi:ABC-type glycerol-3-phosphate transport system substrate-binding protein